MGDLASNMDWKASNGQALSFGHQAPDGKRKSPPLGRCSGIFETSPGIELELPTREATALVPVVHPRGSCER